MLNFLRQYIAPLFAVLLFLIALFAVSVRIFLPSDLAAPAPLSFILYKDFFLSLF